MYLKQRLLLLFSLEVGLYVWLLLVCNPQVTADLAAFWAGSYSEMRKHMKNEYPRHLWPDDPANTEATRLTKRGLLKAAAAEADKVLLASKGSKGSAGGSPAVESSKKKRR